MFSFAIARVPVYTAISNFRNSCSQRFGIGVVLNSNNYFLSTWKAYGASCAVRPPTMIVMNKHPIKCICIYNLQIMYI